MVSHNSSYMEKIEQKKVFATHAEADSHVQEVKQRHEQQKEQYASELRETIWVETEKELHRNKDQWDKSTHTIAWRPGQYESIFRKA